MTIKPLLNSNTAADIPPALSDITFCRSGSIAVREMKGETVKTIVPRRERQTGADRGIQPSNSNACSNISGAESATSSQCGSSRLPRRCSIRLKQVITPKR